MLEVRRLRLLRELSLRGSITAAAAALQQSPAALSQQLRLLEREVGVPLLRRVGRGVQLTSAGEVLAERTAAILDDLERAHRAVSDGGAALTGVLRLAVFQSAAVALLPSVLSDLRRAHPELRVTVSQREPGSALRDTWARDFDLVVAEEYPAHAAPWYDGLDRVPLVADALRLAVPVRGDEWMRIRTIADTAGLPWVMEPQPVASRHWAEQVCRRAGFEPDVRYETADLEAHLALVESGNAVAVIPELMLTRRRGDVRLIDLDGDPRRTVFTAARRAVVDSPAVLAVRAALARAVRAGIGRGTPASGTGTGLGPLLAED